MTNVLTNTIDILIDKENIVEVEKGIMEEECREILQQFFKILRQRKKAEK